MDGYGTLDFMCMTDNQLLDMCIKKYSNKVKIGSKHNCGSLECALCHKYARHWPVSACQDCPLALAGDRCGEDNGNTWSKQDPLQMLNKLIQLRHPEGATLWASMKTLIMPKR
jgi:hypothetical protein